MVEILREFRDTFFRPAMVDVLIALLFGNKLSSTIDSLLIDVIGPMFSHYVYNLDDFSFNLDFSGKEINLTPTIVNITSFLLSITLVFFLIVKPFKAVLEEANEKETKKRLEKETLALNTLQNIEKLIEKRATTNLF